MSTTWRRYGVVVCVFLIGGPAAAQTRPARENQEPLGITLMTTSDRVRFTGPGAALEWRLEVANAQGDPVFDSGVVAGPTLDWPLVDAQGQAVESGLYGYRLTLRSGPGAEERLQRGQVQVERVRSVYQVSAVSTDAAGGGVVLQVVAADEPPVSLAEPVAASPSAAPQPIRPNLGSLSFGIAASGTGTSFSMTKWIDGPAGVLGDTNITEDNGNVVLGNGNFKGNLHIFGSANVDVFAGMGPNLVTGPAFNYGYAGASFGRSAGFFNVRPDASAVAPNPSLRFMTVNVERMILTNTGRAGIGTSTPVAKLEVLTSLGEAVDDDNIMITNFASDGPNYIGRFANGSSAVPSAVLDEDQLVFFGARGFNGTVFNTASSAGIDMSATEDWTALAAGADIRFETTANGTEARTERMRINHDGTVGIGTVAALAEKLHVIGNIRVGTSGAIGCVQRFDGTAIAGACASDLRFKRDITPFPNLLDKVAALRPVHYYWRSSEFPQRQFGTTQSYGLVAQEAEQVLPELVVADEQGYKQVDYAKLPLLTLQAIKELKAENDALKQRLAALEALMTQRSPARR